MYRWAVIPAFNEAETLGEVIKKCQTHRLKVLVVNDGSSDATQQVAEEHGADMIINHEFNSGYDMAIRSGLHAMADREDCQWAVTLDADGQLNPADAERLIDEAVKVEAVMALGVRETISRSAEKLAGFIQKRKTGICDPLCGMKAYRYDLLKTGRECAGYRVGTELAIHATTKGYKWIQSVVSLAPRHRGKSRFAHNLSAEVRLFFVIVFMALFTKGRCA